MSLSDFFKFFVVVSFLTKNWVDKFTPSYSSGTTGCSPIAEYNTHTSHWIYRSWGGICIEPSPWHATDFGTGRFSVHYQMRSVNINPGTNPLIHSGVLPANYARAMAAQSLWESPVSCVPQSHSMRCKADPPPRTGHWRPKDLGSKQTLLFY